MVPEDGFAHCPACGRRDDAAALRPLFVVTGASGSGKSTLLAPISRLLAGRCVVFDADWLIDASMTLSGAASVAELPWDGVAQAWLAVAHGVAQSGLATLLLGSLTPPGLAGTPGREWIGPIHGLLLDCPDEVRQQRIEARPAWRMRDVAEQVRWAEWLRANVPDRLDTSECSVDEAARVVVDWVDRLLHGYDHAGSGSGPT